MTVRLPPRATYRLQFNSNFTFEHARQLVPYLAKLGISHVYASPCLKARPGSQHGYNVVDHNGLNPELGGNEQFAALVDTLHRHGMGLILDWVPNHMDIGGDANAWWLDVLENGRASPYAAYFDIDWRPLRESLRGKVLLPVLGDHYGKVLESGGLTLAFDAQRGEFSLRYYERRFPLDPETYPEILAHKTELPVPASDEEGHTLIEWHGLVADLEQLRALRTAPLERNRAAAALKQRLAMLCQRSPSVREFIAAVLEAFNGVPGQAESFDALHNLLERQSFQLAYWRVASDEINYRRFFDINDLACLRQELPEVFDATHRLLLGLIADGSVDGLRIDHPDGLHDPREYFRRLQSETGRTLRLEPDASPEESCPLYLLVEKILAGYEHLRVDWGIAGTTGYDFANLVNGLFVHPGSEAELTRLYGHQADEDALFDEVLYDRKRHIIQAEMSSELSTLVNLLSGIAQANRGTRDFTVNGLRDALTEVVARFPVYRTYITANGITEEDRRFIAWAIAQAKKRGSAAGESFLDFIQRILLGAPGEDIGADERVRMLRFTMKFQQYTAPVMAKGMEDTAFYVYNRLVALNDVGGDPRRFGVSVAAFHHANQQRLEYWPDAMLNTATHDSKRSGDVRARIDVITELVPEWRRAVIRWRRVNRDKKTVVDGEPAPSRNDEYLLYQTLLGAWPLDPAESADFPDRIADYLVKAVKEAKQRTSWTNPNDEYTRAVADFARNLLDKRKSRAFLKDFSELQTRIAHLGCLNGLSETLLLLTSPGVPDLYQGTEFWRFNLVDPDNRRAVDFGPRIAALDALAGSESTGAVPLPLLARRVADGRAKLFLIWKTLGFRQRHPALFARGDYRPLEAKGERAEHVCAFMRRGDDAAALIVVAPRWFAHLPLGPEGLPLGRETWGDTHIQVPGIDAGSPLFDVLGGTWVGVLGQSGELCLPLGRVLREFPVALLSGHHGNGLPT